MPVKQAIQSQCPPPASLPCIITFLAKCVSGSCIIWMQGAKTRLNGLDFPPLPSSSSPPSASLEKACAHAPTGQLTVLITVCADT